MARRPFSIALALAAALPQAAAAQAVAAESPEPTLDGALPDAGEVAAALDTHPSVEAAHGRLRAAEAEARVLAYGPHELTISTISSLRDVANAGRYAEFEVTATRAVRLPGRAAIDRQTGAYGVDAARNRAEDVQHQAATLLNGLWWDHRLALALAEVDRAALANVRATLAAVERQAALREGSLLEVDLARAAVASAEAQLAASEGEARAAAVRIAAQFPNIHLPAEAGELPVPLIDEATIEAMAGQVVARSHEIGAAEAERLRREAIARRARLDRVPDPSIGVRLFRERGGEERGAGVVFSMPIGGGARRAAADRAAMEASAALSDRAVIGRDVAERSASDAMSVRSALAVWSGRRAALSANVAATTRSRRGYVLGGVNLSDLLLAERQSRDAFRAATQARVAALRAICNLMIDSHNLWIGVDEHHVEQNHDVAGP